MHLPPDALGGLWSLAFPGHAHLFSAYSIHSRSRICAANSRFMRVSTAVTVQRIIDNERGFAIFNLR